VLCCSFSISLLPCVSVFAAGYVGPRRTLCVLRSIVVLYQNKQGELNLWLIEHKLTEQEFTTCGGAKSKGRQAGKHSCNSIVDILQNPSLCYYHSACRYNYWNITARHPSEFARDNLLKTEGCPFKGGLNQLWRNQLLAIAIESSRDWPFKKVFFSVVHHPPKPSLGAVHAGFCGSHGQFRAILLIHL